VSEKHVEILERMSENPNGLKLKQISCYQSIYCAGNMNSNVEFRMATIFKETLEDFNVMGGYHGFEFNFLDFPNMPKLKSFKFGIKDLGDIPVNLNNIFPALETLNVKFEYDTYESEGEWETLEFFSQFHVCPIIKTLILEKNLTGIRTFHNILRVFPNLRKLTFRFGEDESEAGQILQQIWAGMTQLESLSVSAFIHFKEGMSLDSLLTGIPIQALQDIRHVIPNLETMTVEKRREEILSVVEQHGTQEPSIRNLTNLRHLHLNLSWSVEWNLIHGPSDMTGYFGIYLMKHLNQLDIQHCDFTKTCCEILTMETSVEAWKFQTGGSGEIGPKHIIPPFQIPCREPNYN